MQIEIKEAYAGELKEKSGQVLESVKKMIVANGGVVHDTGCTCGCHGDSMEKAINDIQTAKEDSPYKLIRQIRDIVRADAEMTNKAAVNDVSRYLLRRTILNGEVR